MSSNRKRYSPWRLFSLFLAIYATSGAISADDEVDVEEGTVRIYIGNADGSEMKRLTDLAEFPYQGSVDWSDEGGKIGFDAYRPQMGETYLQSKIIVVDEDGQNARVLGDGAMPSFSPKGNRLAYSRYGQGVWWMDLKTPEAPVLIDARGWGTDWSPDGTQIAYSKESNLLLYNMIEGTTTPLLPETSTKLRQIYWNFAWDRENCRVAFTAHNQENQLVLGMVDARGEAHGLTLLPIEVGTGLAWNADSTELLVWIKDQLYLLKPETPIQLTRIEKQPPGVGMSSPMFSADGKRLAASLFKRGLGKK